MTKGAPQQGRPCAIESCEELDFSSCWISSACAISTAPSLAGRLYHSAIWLQGKLCSEFVLGTRLGLVVLRLILIDVFVLSFRLHLLGVGFALALVAAGGVVIRHVRRHDEFFEADSFPGSDAPSYFVDQIIVVLAAEPFELLVLGELNSNAASHFRLQLEPAFASPLAHDRSRNDTARWR